MPTITPINRTVTPSVSVQNRPATNLTVTPASRPNNPVQVTVQSRTVQVAIGSSNVSGQSFTHTQSTPAATWTIPNPWGVRAASVQVMVAGEIVMAYVLENTGLQTVVQFSQPQSGLVDLTKGA